MARIVDLTTRYRALGGVVHLCYLPHWWWVRLGSPDLSPLTGAGLALISSNYPAGGYSDTGPGWTAYGGVSPAAWQYSDAQLFNGQRVDFNAYRGTVDQLWALTTGGATVALTTDDIHAVVEGIMGREINGRRVADILGAEDPTNLGLPQRFDCLQRTVLTAIANQDATVSLDPASKASITGVRHRRRPAGHAVRPVVGGRGGWQRPGGGTLPRVVAAVELYVDQVADRRLRRLWDAMEEAGVPSLRDLTHRRHRPHVSLIAAPTLDGGAVRDALRGFDVAPPLRLDLDFVGLFRGRVLWLGPVVTPDLIAHQAAVFNRLRAAGVAAFPEYRPGAWVPHCTLSMRVPHPKMPEALRLCMDVLPVPATVTGAAVADHARDLYLPLATG